MPITPTKQLVYHPCFDDLQCARLEVPMDYKSTAGDRPTVAIALLKIPAKVPITDPRYGGVILINPGGPGGSGVNSIFDGGRQVQQVADAHASGPGKHLFSDERYFDIVGFDPRGINKTTPKLSCFPDSLARGIWVLQEEAEGFIGSSDIALDTKWSRLVSLSEGCSSIWKSEKQDTLPYHMNTPVVVTDMVEIVERHGEWRELQASAWLDSCEGQKSTSGLLPSDEYSRESVLERTKWRKGEEQLQYWGVSYGTTIGTTFASLYPSRSSRLVLDGVMGVEEHYDGTWLSSLNDADLILDKFFTYCHLAGKSECPMHFDNIASIQDLFMDIYTRLQNETIPLPGSKTLVGDVLNFSDLSVLIRASFYDPIHFFPTMANILYSFSQGNTTPFAEFKQLRREVEAFYPLGYPYVPDEQCKLAGSYSEACQSPNEFKMEAAVAVQCTDAKKVIETKESFKKYAAIIREQSKYIGDFWPELRLSCVGWNIRPKWYWDGPFTGNLTHPMLLIGNTWDPVTPVRNAHHVAKGFEGSVVLEQESAGVRIPSYLQNYSFDDHTKSSQHGSTSSPSMCTMRIVRQYFQTGKLPPPDQVCRPDKLPFMGSAVDLGTLSTDDHVLYEALEILSKAHGRLFAPR
ncbi:Peptidase S33 tripeptidyl aminopeptidase-like C-terminal protein [Rutstroemia sp. NJR-2017a BVV2]|nr:Peptidase S33 tripeptidyl aminopeptidase-like C-terminal protein [Rutstroemia sp. NJR-2017a BVV2]